MSNLLRVALFAGSHTPFTVCLIARVSTVAIAPRCRVLSLISLAAFRFSLVDDEEEFGIVVREPQ